MADRPIIFSSPMVCALLDGRKTMTRRLATSPLAKCNPDDRLWVREAFQVPALCDVQYRATATERIGHWNPERGPWKPSIHMPRWASRLTLTVTVVKLQRLQKITEEDAAAEGVDGGAMTARGAFFALWNSLHGPGSWEANPEVVAISFTAHRGNIDAGMLERAG